MLVSIASVEHIQYAHSICETIKQSASVRGTGIAERTPDYVISKILSGNAVIALDENQFAGFCYIETWDQADYVVHSGLIVHPKYRNQGLAFKIKQRIFNLSKEKYPKAKIFGITTGLPVMKINTALGYKPVTFSKLTADSQFWDGCSTCKNYQILQEKNRSMCLCTAMLYDPLDTAVSEERLIKYSVWQRLKRIKGRLLIKVLLKK